MNIYMYMYKAGYHYPFWAYELKRSSTGSLIWYWAGCFVSTEALLEDYPGALPFPDLGPELADHIHRFDEKIFQKAVACISSP